MKDKYCTKVTIKKVKGNKYINAIVGKDFKAREIFVERNTWAILIYPQEKACYKEYKNLEFNSREDAKALMSKNYEKFYKDGACIFSWDGPSNLFYRVTDSDVKRKCLGKCYDACLEEEEFSVTRVNIFNEFIKGGMDPMVAKILESYFDTLKNLDKRIVDHDREIRNIKDQLEYIKDDISDIKWLISPYDSIKGRINKERFIAQARKIDLGPRCYSRNNYVLCYDDQRKLENMGYVGNVLIQP